MTRILVINDTQELLEMFRLLLEQDGYEVVLSGIPILKVKQIEEIEPDLIVLDMIFGEHRSGWQMLQMLKMQRSTAHIPVVVCTAALREVQEQEGYLVTQGVLVIYKPFDIDEFLTLIKQALGTRLDASMHMKDHEKEKKDHHDKS
jgi:DNA-binding response OmpR family regulator